ncbi:MAG TPA: lysophospholipid acyltransferase family protein [Urbifossiella sp.]
MNRRWRRRCIDLAAYLAVRLIICVVQAVPPRLAYHVADAVARVANACLRRRRETARDNIREAFPHLDANPASVDRLVLNMYRHFARVALEFLLISRKIRRSTLRRYISFPDETAIGALLHSNRPVLVVTAHFGNWELAGVAFGLLGYHTHAIARVLDNPYLERFFLRLRQASGQTIIAKRDDFARLDEVLEQGGNVATLADQDAGPRGVFVNFFGRPASTHKAVALLAIKYDAIMVVGSVPRLARSEHSQAAGEIPANGLETMFYSYVLEEVIDPRDYAKLTRAAALKAITERYTAAFERFIRKHPEQYFWLHRRWKSQPPLRSSRSAA